MGLFPFTHSLIRPQKLSQETLISFHCIECLVLVFLQERWDKGSHASLTFPTRVQDDSKSDTQTLQAHDSQSGILLYLRTNHIPNHSNQNHSKLLVELKFRLGNKWLKLWCVFKTSMANHCYIIVDVIWWMNRFKHRWVAFSHHIFSHRWSLVHTSTTIHPLIMSERRWRLREQGAGTEWK